MRRAVVLGGLAVWLLVLGAPAPAVPRPSAPAGAVSATARTWNAEWIWDRPPAAEKNVYTYFRKTFDLVSAPASARAWITADSHYVLFVNGRLIGRGPVRSDPRVAQYYDTYDIAAALQPGVNVIAVVVHFFGEGNERYLPGRGGLLFEASVSTGAPAPLAIRSDATWRALRSAAWNGAAPRENDSNGFMEIFDARLEPAGWAQPAFDTSAWTVPFVIGPAPQPPWPALAPRDIPAMAEFEMRAAAVTRVGEVARAAGDPLLVAPQVEAEVAEAPSTVVVSNAGFLVAGTGAPTTVVTPVGGRDALIVLDFGRVISGFPVIVADAAAGGVIDVTFSEWLDEDGEIAAVRSPVRFKDFEGRPMFTADRVILRAGRTQWQRFFFSSFRYLQLTVRDASSPVVIRHAGAVFTSYPHILRGSFRSSDERLNRIWSVGAYTTLLSTYDTFMDCPWREKGQWMDMATPLVSYNAFGDRAVAARFLRTSTWSQNSEGRLFFPYPSWFSFELPDQTMWWGMHVWQYYLHFGDIEVLADVYPALVRVNAWFQAHLSPRGLLNADWPNDGPRVLWPWIDHGHRHGANEPGTKRGEMAALDALYYKFLVDAANIARAVGRSADAASFDAQARGLRDAINAAYWDPAAGVYWDDVAHTIGGEQAGVLAVLYGIAPADQWGRILDTVMDDQFRVGESSPHFYFFVLDALAKAGLYGRALDTIAARWGALLDAGATTWWEGWTLERDLFGRPWPAGEHHNLSLTHGYASAPTYFLSTMALGVRPIAPGFSRVLVAPNAGSLQWAEGAVPSPHGSIRVGWAAGAAFSLSLAIPAPVTAVVSVPRLAGDEVSVDGQVVWRAGAPVAAHPRVRAVGAAGGRTLLEAAAGQYAFISR